MSLRLWLCKRIIKRIEYAEEQRVYWMDRLEVNAKQLSTADYFRLGVETGYLEKGKDEN